MDADGERTPADAIGGGREVDALLEHVEQLIARVFGSSSDEEDGDEQQAQDASTSSAVSSVKALAMGFSPEEEVEPAASLSSLQAPQATEDGAASGVETGREKVLQRKLARTLLELAEARDNAQLAARAGTVLLEKLSRAEGEADALREELEVSGQEVARLQRTASAMEDQLRRFELVEAPTRRHSELAASSSSSWRSGPSYKVARSDEACRECDERRQEARAARQDRDQLRRQCLELELQAQSANQTERDLRRELERSNDRARRLQSELAAVSSDREALADSHKALQSENARLEGVRETLRATVRALRADKRTASDRLVECEHEMEALDRDKRDFATRAQIADNRRARAERDCERLLQTLAELSRDRRSANQQEAEQTGSVDGGDEDRGQERRRRPREDRSEATTAAELFQFDSSESNAPKATVTALSIDTSDASLSPSTMLYAPAARVRPPRVQEVLLLPQDTPPSLADAPTTTSTTSPVTPLAVAARRAVVVERLSGVDHYCIAGSGISVNGPDIRLLEAQTHQQEHPREFVSSNSGDATSKESAKKLPPPTPPMYIGLSLLVACATAAGIAARR